MRKTIKIMSLLLTVAMMLTMALPMTVSASFSDVPSNHHYYDAIHNLSAEGILNGMGDGTFAPGDPVTRAQFTKVICYALSVGNLTYSEAEKSIFTDVAPEHWAADNIVTAYKQGIINGMGDGTFAPEAGVNYEQAVKMVVCALGYSPERAESLGGYPGGYMSLANTAKILKNINDAKMGTVMTRGAVAQLIDNMLDADQIQDGQPGGSIRDEISTSKSYAGQVVAGYGVALYDDTANGNELEACRRNEIIVETGAERMYFDVSEIDFDIYKYLGRSVIVYYEKETGVTVDVASSIALQPRKNQETKINLDMIYDYDSSTIEYFTDSSRTNTQKISYEMDSDNLYNGLPVADDLETLLDTYGTSVGHLTLVSSQTNTVADVAFLKTYETMIVQQVDSRNAKVYGKYGVHSTGIVLDVDDRSKNVTITSNGSDYALSSIRENHILSISRSAGDKVIEVLVSTKTASGTIKEMPSTNEIKLSSGNTIYTLSPDIKVHDGVIGDVVAGKHVSVSLDAFGMVARVVFTAEASFNYGYLSDLELHTPSNSNVSIMVYKPVASNTTLTGTIYTLADKVKIDGTVYEVEEEMTDIKNELIETAGKPAITGFHSSIAPSNDTYAQPIRYTVDNAGKINAILTNVSNVGESATTLKIVNNVASPITCTVDGTTFGTYTITPSTPIVYVPQDRAGTYYGKNNQFFNQGETYYVQFANVSGAGQVSCVYLYGGSSGSISATITEDTLPMIVTYKSQKEHMNSVETFIKVRNILTGEEDTVEYFEDSVDLDVLEVGDVIRFASGADDYVEALEVLADAADVAAGSFATLEVTDGSGSGIDYEFRTLIGTVKSKEGNTFTVVSGYNGGAAGGESYLASSTTPIYVIDTAANETNRVTEATMGEIVGYASNATLASRVMIYTVEAGLKAIVIFK